MCWGLFLKRVVDVVGALGGLVLLCVPMILVSLLVLAKMGRPVLFRHIRPGLEGQPFTLLKFRTMSGNGGSFQFALENPDEHRLTPFGRWLRASSLDEMPELFNVLKGDMSLVGPRPLFMEYFGRYSPEQARRHNVKPGITGWAQVNGRDAISWEEKFRLDVWYVDNRTLWLDLKILAMTTVRVLCRHGVIDESKRTVPPFMLSDKPKVKDGLAE